MPGLLIAALPLAVASRCAIPWEQTRYPSVLPVVRPYLGCLASRLSELVEIFVFDDTKRDEFSHVVLLDLG